MKVFVNSASGDVVTLNVTPKTTIADIKADLECVDSVLTLGPKILDNESATLEELEVAELSTLNCSARLLGGKVHGSLARAGKVRAQTPKVEKQEKRKKKRGRAWRRQQYNKRFVNQAVQGPGRKRGPNSNTA
ncbi:unnamed protein product [Bursaphelenchus xylophilus]|uniref:(pine wood nematode) hypothetical protein n=1 Tax=Bursaphelenchus xylophilus TaxID=6326 RepID=A0A1I7S806_BURXY|nr:unnamed protein product [Bursaphelenchus xylophilus]CAG9087310.1 unnamed protein product [Bursaphelenchus xylophilus]